MTLLLFGLLFGLLAAAHANPAAFYEGLTMARLRGNAVSVPWTPADLSATIYSWYNDTTLTTAGIRIGVWQDISGNNRSFYETFNDDYRPLVKTTNGLNYLEFTQFDRFASVSNWVTLSQPFYSVALGRVPVTPQNDADFMVATSPSAFNWRPKWSSVGGTQSLYYLGNAAATRPQLPNWSVGGFINSVYWNTTNSYVMLNTNEATGNVGTGSVGTPKLLNDDSWQLDVYELLFVSGVISAIERQKLEGYLAHKWNLAGNLPADHPWKNQAPTK
jgi:hypothetical protein